MEPISTEGKATSMMTEDRGRGALAGLLRGSRLWASLAGAALALASCSSNATRDLIEARIAADLGPEVAKRAMVKIEQRAQRSDSYLESCRKSLMESPARFYRQQGLLKGPGLSDRDRKQLDEEFGSAPTMAGVTVADLTRISLAGARARLHPIRVAGAHRWGFTCDLESGAHARLTYDRDLDPDAYRSRPTSIIIYSRQYEEFGRAADVGVDEAGLKGSKYRVSFEPWLHLGVSLVSRTQRALPCASKESLRAAARSGR